MASEYFQGFAGKLFESDNTSCYVFLRDKKSEPWLALSYGMFHCAFFFTSPIFFFGISTFIVHFLTFC